MKSNSLELELLIKKANKGDQKAYYAFLHKITPALRNFVSKKIAATDEVEDVLQEILISIHKARHTYDGTRPLMPWIYAIAKFRLVDHLRKSYEKKLEVNIDDLPEIADEHVTNSLSFYESIRKEIDSLSGKQPKILELMYIYGFTTKEVGQKLNMKESAVKVAAHRAYKVLRKKLSV